MGIRNYVIPSSEGCSKAGSLAAQITTSKPVENCFSEGKIISAGNVGSVGGLFGSLKGYAVNCYTRTDITVTYDCAAQQYSSTWKIGGFAAEIGCGASSIGTEHGNLECVVEVGGAENCYASGDILITGGTPNVRHYIGTFVGGFESARKYVYKNCFALGTIDYTGYRPGGLSSDFCGPFVGSQSPFNLTTENLYVCVTVTGHDGAKDDFKCTAATREELCSLDFLEANMSFDRNIWAQNESEPPALKAYEVNL